MEDKPEGWNETLDDLIRANFSYEDSNKALKKKYGDLGTLGGIAYRDHKNKLTGGDKADGKLDELGGHKRIRKPTDKNKPKAPWTAQKQKAADASKLGQIINMGVYQGMLPFCANKELKEGDVQEINPGGAVIAILTYYFPESKLEHPLVMLGIRVVILYIKFKSVCGKLQQVKDKVAHMGKSSSLDGLKPGMKTDIRQ